MDITAIEIASDSMETISLINEETVSCSNIFLECRELVQKLKSPPIKHHRRKQNQVADLLAKEGARLESNGVFVKWTTTPPFVTKAVEADKWNYSFVNIETNPLQCNIPSSMFNTYVISDPTDSRLMYPPGCMDAY